MVLQRYWSKYGTISELGWQYLYIRAQQRYQSGDSCKRWHCSGTRVVISVQSGNREVLGGGTCMEGRSTVLVWQ